MNPSWFHGSTHAETIYVSQYEHSSVVWWEHLLVHPFICLLIYFSLIWVSLCLWPLVRSQALYLRSLGGTKSCFHLQVSNHGSSNQMVCSSASEGSSGRLNALCILSSPLTWMSSPQQHWGPREGVCFALEERDGSGIHTAQNLANGTGKDIVGVGGRELVIGVEGKQESS